MKCVMDKSIFEDLEKKRTKCEIYSRVVGYMRPVSQWNPGKIQEFNDRRYYDIDKFRHVNKDRRKTKTNE